MTATAALAPKQLFLRLLKADALRREIVGIAAAEEPDEAGEILDYATAKAEFADWSARAKKRSGGKSLGNVREMHSLSAVGRLISLDFDDDAKQILVTAKVVDDAAWAKVEEGVYTGFSLGGHYKKRWPDPAGTGLTRYTPRPNEISLVDAPCIPSATYELIRADGALEIRKFAAPPPFEEDAQLEQPRARKSAPTKSVDGEDHPASDFAYAEGEPSEWKYPIFDASHVRNALARWGQAKGIPADQKDKVFARIKAAASKFGIKVGGSAEKVIKSLYDVGGIAYALSDLDFKRQCLLSEAILEGDGSEIPGKILEIEIALAGILKELAIEEADELLAQAGITGEDEMTPAEKTALADEITNKVLAALGPKPTEAAKAAPAPAPAAAAAPAPTEAERDAKLVELVKATVGEALASFLKEASAPAAESDEAKKAASAQREPARVDPATLKQHDKQDPQDGIEARLAEIGKAIDAINPNAPDAAERRAKLGEERALLKIKQAQQQPFVARNESEIGFRKAS